MSDDYIPTPQWAANMPTLLDGDAPDEATFRVTEEDQYDRLQYLYELKHTETGTPRQLEIAMFDPADWTFHFATTPGGWRQDVLNRHIYFPFKAPHGSTLRSAKVMVNPANTHSAVPAGPPEIHVYKVNPSTGVQTLMATAVDLNVGSVAAYEALHQVIVIVGLSGEVIDNETYRYFIVLEGESGANAETGMLVLGASITFDMTNLDPGAS